MQTACDEVADYYESLDPFATSSIGVSWAGEMTRTYGSTWRVNSLSVGTISNRSAIHSVAHFYQGNRP